MSPLYPLFLDLDRQPVVVIGGGRVAERRIPRLIACGARVVVISPRVTPAIDAWGRAGELRWLPRTYEPEDLAGVRVVLLAVGDTELLEKVRADARRRGVLLNTAEDAQSADFHVPAALEHGGVQIAISTGGASPRLASGLRRDIESLLEGVDAGRVQAARDARAVRHRSMRRDDGSAGGRPARVALVGAGPGDPDLLTLRGRDRLTGADVVFHDRLVGPAVLALLSPRTECVFAGKEVGCRRGIDVVAAMAAAARQGRRVVRLKGGDPVLFGRGGEEILALAREGVDVEVVPGISALLSVPAAAGIPVTHRSLASELVVRSGHLADGQASLSAAGRDVTQTTYVYFMAVRRIAQVTAGLTREGLPTSTPAALIENGTRPEQRVVTGTLASIAHDAVRERVESPALLVVGNVVRLRDAKSPPTHLPHPSEATRAAGVAAHEVEP